ncbi:MAG: carboxypeptidase-like regulatory domain-containing protein [Gemmatimonadota bacterium]
MGHVVNATTGRPVDGAVVSLILSGFGALTDSTGAFRIPRTFAGADTLEVRYIGFEPSRTSIELPPEQTSRITLLLSPTVVRVAELTVEVRQTRRSAKLAGFIERREKGFGTFFTPRDIRNRNPRLPSDLLRGIPGVTVGRIVHGQAPVYFNRGGGGPCPPAVFLDGVYQSGLQVDDIPPEDLGAVEVYKGITDTPVEFMRTGGRTCGAVVIWTPDGPDFMDWDPDLSPPR